ncbi:MAG: T9SS type A sorting domain-containing protein [Ignavibacteria bacterium]|nr:T9SS type A sorting domain-containing protein [Ignavibacteria bacterium]
MKKLFLLVLFIFSINGLTKSQNWTESFEGLDSLSLPQGWSKYNAAAFPIDPFTNWTVRDSGSSLPGLTSATAKSHSGLKSIGVSWWASIDTNGSGTTISDAWLVTKRIHVNDASGFLSYYMALGGGAGPYRDSVQIWISTVDSLPQHFNHYVETISGTGPYGTFNQNFVPFTDYAGQDIWVGFRYNMDCTTDGYFVNLDDIEVVNPIGIIPISTEIPRSFELKQNYPNPFNPVTNIEFSIAKTRPVNLVVYNSVGQLVATLVNEELKPGTYKYDYNASNLPSGAYYYRLTAGDFVKTNKMILVK